ncbi:MAG: bifunctional DNA primase/polymerase [Thermofilaceae archaeon]
MKETALFYLQDWGISVVPLKAGTKIPACRWGEFTKRFMTPEEVEEFEWGGIAFVTGSLSRLVVIDADSPESAELVRKHFPPTVTVKTRRGVHFYYTVEDLPESFGCRRIISHELGIELDVKANGGLVTAPPSVVKHEDGSTVEYVFEGDEGGVGRPFAVLGFLEFKQKLEALQAEVLPAPHEEEEELPQLSGADAIKAVERIVEVVKRHYVEGQRQNLCLALCGLMRKLGVEEQVASEVIERLASEQGDRDLKQRLSAVKNTYAKPLSEVAGLKFLKELIPYEDYKKVVEFLFSHTSDEGFEIFTLAGVTYAVADGYLYLRRLRRVGGVELMSYEQVGPYLRVVGVAVDPESSRHYMEVEYEAWGEKQRVFVEGADITEFEKVTGVPVIAPLEFKRYLFEYARQIKSSVKKKLLLRSTGWLNQTFYAPNLQNGNSVIWRIPPLYARKFAVRNCAEQHAFIRMCLESGKDAGLVMLLAVASLFLKPCDGTPFAVFVIGMPRVGKTLCCRLAVQMFYESPVFTLNATDAAVEFSLKYFRDLPLLFDEAATKLKSLDLERLIFTISSGTGRLRGTKTLDLQLSELRSVVFFTANKDEIGLFENAASLWRIIPLYVRSWEQLFPCERLQVFSVADGCVGCGFDYVKLLNSDTELLQECVEEGRKTAEELASIGGMERVLHPIGAALVFLERYYGCRFDELRERLRQHLEWYSSLIRERKDYVSQFIDKLLEHISRSYSKVYVDEDLEHSTKVKEVEVRVSGNKYYVIPGVFRKFCDELNIAPEILLKELEEKGIAVKKDGRYQTVQRLMPKAPPVRCYAFQLPPELTLLLL